MGGAIAPPLFLFSISDGMEFASEFARKYFGKNILPNLAETYQVFSEWEFFEPIRVGSKIIPKRTLADIYWKQGKNRRLLFIVGETSFRNEEGQLLAKTKGAAVFCFK